MMMENKEISLNFIDTQNSLFVVLNQSHCLIVFICCDQIYDFRTLGLKLDLQYSLGHV